MRCSIFNSHTTFAFDTIKLIYLNKTYNIKLVDIKQNPKKSRR